MSPLMCLHMFWSITSKKVEYINVKRKIVESKTSNYKVVYDKNVEFQGRRMTKTLNFKVVEFSAGQEGVWSTQAQT